jgi:hypothetical protein
MPSEGFEPTTSAIERLQSYTLEDKATGVCCVAITSITETPSLLSKVVLITWDSLVSGLCPSSSFLFEGNRKYKSKVMLSATNAVQTVQNLFA